MDRTAYINEQHARFGIAQPQVVDVVQELTGRTVAFVERLISGDEYEVHRIRLADDSVSYLRIAWPGAPEHKTRDEASAMTRAGEAGIGAPEVLALTSIPSDDGDRQAMLIGAATGQQLGSLAATLSADQRSTAVAGIGTVLRTLHSIAMPGSGLPDDQGRWEHPRAKRNSYIANVLDDSQQLAAVGLTPTEVERVREIVRSPIVPLEDPPVLCHGDLSDEHVFVDDELRVVGLIDWGQWYAGSASSELAGFAMRHPKADWEALAAGYGLELDQKIRDQLCWHLICQTTGEIRWLITSGQHAELDGPATALRSALASIHS